MTNSYFNQIAWKTKRLLGPTPDLDQFLSLLIEDVTPAVSVRSQNVISKNFPDIKSFISFDNNKFLALRNAGVSSVGEIKTLQEAFIKFAESIADDSNKNFLASLNPIESFLTSLDPIESGEANWLPLNSNFPKLSTLPLDTLTLQILNRQELPRRALNLISKQFTHIGPLLEQSEYELGRKNNVGAGTIKSILSALKTAEENFSELPSANTDKSHHDRAQISINLKDLNNVRNYLATFGHSILKTLFESPKGHNLPEGIELACDRLLKSLFPAITDAKSPAIDLDSEMKRLLDATLDFRAQQVVDYRYLKTPLLTLEQTGDKLNVTRERIRQIEQKSLQILIDSVNTGDFPVFGWILPALEVEYGLCFTLNELKTFISKTPLVHCSDFGRLWGTLRAINSENYNFKNDCVISKALSITPYSNKPASEIFGSQVVQARVAIANKLHELKWSPEIIENFLPTLKSLPGDYVYPRSANAEDLVFSILLLNDRPLHIDSIMEKLGHSYSKNGLRERLRFDSRFIKLINHQIALASWDYEEILMIKDEIDNFIRNKPEEIAGVNGLITSLEKRGFKPNSIRAYLSAPKYEVFNHKVRIRKTFNSIDLPTNLSKAKRFYPLGEENYSLRIKISPDTIRGIGPNISSVVFARLGGSIDETTTFHCGDHDIRMTWNPNIPQPTLSTLRSLCKSANTINGAEILLLFNTKKRTFRFEIVDNDSLSDPIAVVRSITGISLPVDPDSQTEHLVRLFSCSNQQQLETILLKREDDILLKILQKERSPQTDFDISDLL